MVRSKKMGTVFAIFFYFISFVVWKIQIKIFPYSIPKYELTV